jgi:hypothetical protein
MASGALSNPCFAVNKELTRLICKLDSFLQLNRNVIIVNATFLNLFLYKFFQNNWWLVSSQTKYFTLCIDSFSKGPLSSVGTSVNSSKHQRKCNVIGAFWGLTPKCFKVAHVF